MLAATERTSHQLARADVGVVLDEFGGLLGVLGSATVAARVAVHRAARLGITYHPDRRSTLRVDVGVGFACASEG